MNGLVVGLIFILSSLFSIQKVLKIARRRKKDSVQTQIAAPYFEEIQPEAEVPLFEEAYLVLNKELELHSLLQLIQRLSINHQSIQIRVDLIILNGEHYTLVWCEQQFAANLSEQIDLTQPPKQYFSELEQILFASKVNLDSFLQYVNYKHSGIHRLFMIIENGMIVTVVSQSFTDKPTQNAETNAFETLMFSQLITKLKYKPAINHRVPTQRQRSLREHDNLIQSSEMMGET